MFADPNDEIKKHIFGLYFNFTIYWVGILMEKDYELDLTEGGFASFLGNRKKVLKNAMTGKILPEITRGVEWIFLHWDLIT